MNVYPSLQREAHQKIEASFKTCRAYDMTFDGEQIFVDPANPNMAQVSIQSTYS